jgi:nucleoside-diphosphate-sugar epimerase
MTKERVLLTGGSGFIAGHCVLRLLEQGFLVRTTVRSLERENTVRAVLADAGMVHDDALSFVEADLTDDAGWADAVRGCDFVLHIASPVHTENVKNDDDVIVPAREGTLRVLRAAAAQLSGGSCSPRPSTPSASATPTLIGSSPRMTGPFSTAPASTRTARARSSPNAPPGGS